MGRVGYGDMFLSFSYIVLTFIVHPVKVLCRTHSEKATPKAFVHMHRD